MLATASVAPAPRCRSRWAASCTAKRIADRLRALIRQRLICAGTADAVGVGHHLGVQPAAFLQQLHAGGERGRRGRLALQSRAVEFEQQSRRDAQDHALRIAQHQYPAVIGQARQRHLQLRLVAVQLAPQRRRRRRTSAAAALSAWLAALPRPGPAWPA